MGFFSGISGVQRNNNSVKGNWFKDGRYLVEISRLEAKNKRDSGQPIAIVEGYIVEVLSGDTESNTEGDKVAWFNDLSRKPDNNLTDVGKRGMSRVKTFIAELLGGDSAGVTDNDITEDICEQLFGAVDGYTGEETKGVRLIATAKTTISEKTQKPFTNVYWRAVSPAE
tara:strand:- start:1672 stop:2178 length:507 start_codon:yes stop_codon:yes gene_type:complete